MDYFDRYLKSITPRPGDPTYSLLKSHLLFEELLRLYLDKVLPHSHALEGARLTFAQVLAVSRAASHKIPFDHWIWKAIGDLNKLRNMLAHNLKEDELKRKIDEYVNFVVRSLNKPLPEPFTDEPQSPTKNVSHPYLSMDMATIGLYGFVGGILGVDPVEPINTK